MPFYENDIIYILSAGDKYLSVDRSNLLVRELPITPGTENNPGLCFQGDERTGLYKLSEGVLALSSLGWTSFSFSNNQFTFFDRSGNKLNLKASLFGEKTIYFPFGDGTLALREDRFLIRNNNETTETIYSGMVVALDSDTGVTRALLDNGFAISIDTVAITDPIRLIYNGIVKLEDWTESVGTTTLVPGSKYYLSDTLPGQITETQASGAQYVGLAISTTELLIKL